MAKQPDVAMRGQIRSIRKAMTRLVQALEGLLPLLREAEHSAPARARLKLSRARRAALKLHGAYLGHVRTLKARDKARVKMMYKQRGVVAAIALAKRLAK